MLYCHVTLSWPLTVQIWLIYAHRRDRERRNTFSRGLGSSGLPSGRWCECGAWWSSTPPKCPCRKPVAPRLYGCFICVHLHTGCSQMNRLRDHCIAFTCIVVQSHMDWSFMDGRCCYGNTLNTIYYFSVSKCYHFISHFSQWQISVSQEMVNKNIKMSWNEFACSFKTVATKKNIMCMCLNIHEPQILSK